MSYLFNHHILRTRVWGRLYRRDLIGENRFPEDLGHGEDSIFNLLVLSGDVRNIRCFYIKEKMYCYYQREDSIVHSLTSFEKMAKCYWVLEHIDDFSDVTCRRLLLEESCKSLLNNRYLCQFEKDAVERTQECIAISKKIQPLLRNNCNGMPLIKRIVYLLFVHCPSAYRIYRLVSDPSMIMWIKQRKPQ